MVTLRKTTVENRCESEVEVEDLIAKAKENARGVITYKTTYKTKKVKGEIVDFWWIVAITEDFTQIDNPE